jgi:hypothetical protein
MTSHPKVDRIFWFCAGAVAMVVAQALYAWARFWF